MRNLFKGNKKQHDVIDFILVFIFNFEQMSDYSGVSIVNFEQVNAGWVWDHLSTRNFEWNKVGTLTAKKVRPYLVFLEIVENVQH